MEATLTDISDRSKSVLGSVQGHVLDCLESQRLQNGSSIDVISNPIPTELAIATEDQAIAYFFCGFDVHPKPPQTMGPYFDELASMYANAPSSSPLHAATNAVAMSALSNHKGAQYRRHEADTMYGCALKLVNAAVGDPCQSKTDDTLMCVLLLQLFEVSDFKEYLLTVNQSSSLA